MKFDNISEYQNVISDSPPPHPPPPSSVIMTLCEQKSVCDSLLSNIDTSGFVLKTKYNTDKSDLEKKISDADKKVPDTSGLV